MEGLCTPPLSPLCSKLPGRGSLGPAVSAYWRYFSLCQLGLYFSHRAHPERDLVCATGEPEAQAVWEGALPAAAARPTSGIASHCTGCKQTLVCPASLAAGARSRDFTDALRRYESQRHTLAGFLAWLRRAFHPFPPAGLRHNTLPVHGILVRQEGWCRVSEGRGGVSSGAGRGARCWRGSMPGGRD